MAVRLKGPSSAYLFSVCCVYVLCSVSIALGQQVTPFLGRGIPPEGGAEVYVSVLLDRLLSVDVVNYDFEASLYIVLTWNDGRAINAVNTATMENNTCEFPCSNLYAYQPEYSTCCDAMWLPHLEFLNCKGFPQDRVVRYAVRFPENNSSTAVAWWAQVHGKFYNPFLFKSFPFDSQRLIIQVSHAVRDRNSPIFFIPSSTAREMFTPRAGDDISGWKLKNVGITPFNISLNHLMEGASKSNANDPYPINPPSIDQIQFQGYLWQQGFYIEIDINRISIHYVITAIIPIVLNVWLAFLVYSISPSHLDTRLTILVTLFLSLTALMFVISTTLPQSSDVVPTQQLFIVSYLVLSLIGLESIFSNYIATTKSRMALQEKNARARSHFLQRLNTLDRSQQTSIDQEQPPLENAAESSIEETDRFESQNSESGIRKLSSGFRHREQSSARSQSAHDQRIPDPKVTKSKPGKFGWYKRLKDWYSWKLVEYKESWEEVKENPDYAHYVARQFDFYTALITFVAFNVVAILLLAIQSQEQPTIYYG